MKKKILTKNEVNNIVRVWLWVYMHVVEYPRVCLSVWCLKAKPKIYKKFPKIKILIQVIVRGEKINLLFSAPLSLALLLAMGNPLLAYSGYRTEDICSSSIRAKRLF